MDARLMEDVPQTNIFVLDVVGNNVGHDMDPAGCFFSVIDAKKWCTGKVRNKEMDFSATRLDET